MVLLLMTTEAAGGGGGGGLGVKLLAAANVTIPAVFMFGDSIVDTGNNNDNLKTPARCNFPPYGRDFQGGIPTGRYSNGKVPSDFIGCASFAAASIISRSLCFFFTLILVVNWPSTHLTISLISYQKYLAQSFLCCKLARKISMDILVGCQLANQLTSYLILLITPTYPSLRVVKSFVYVASGPNLT